MSKIREKESLECGRMHIWALKIQKLPGPLSGPWTPVANCSLRSHDSASLRRQLSASAPGAPPWPNPGSAPALGFEKLEYEIMFLLAEQFWCKYNMDNSNIHWGSWNRSFIELKVQNNQRNKLFERAWPLRLVAPLFAWALLPSMCFWEGILAWVWC